MESETVSRAAGEEETMEWTQAALEVFGLSGTEPCTAASLAWHCQACGFDTPPGLRDAPGRRVECDAPEMSGWVGTAPRLVGDRWILAQ